MAGMEMKFEAEARFEAAESAMNEQWDEAEREVRRIEALPDAYSAHSIGRNSS